MRSKSVFVTFFATVAFFLTLQDLLTDGRLIFPEEDADEFAALGKKLRDTFQPSDLLESLVVVDYIRAQWRLDRFNHLQNIHFERLSTSATATNCGPGFAHISDYQSNRALEPLCQYEGALRKHQERRMSLFRKLRLVSKPGKNAANFPPPESTPDQSVHRLPRRRPRIDVETFQARMKKMQKLEGEPPPEIIYIT